MAKLTGIGLKKPKKLSAEHFFSKKHYDDMIKPQFERQWSAYEEAGLAKKEQASVRADVTRQIFNALPSEYRAKMEQEAMEAKVAADKLYQRVIKDGFPTDPESRQR